ncbi:4-hydroxy-tetrahydrodipicolinate reductase [Xanthovirga aplysinae]|uniref:4-hydroxy-tetrahydrodipicolinate reductase n=1 Tax=Xanthovirga aplysinae TaxID=2529853 RepID=UPI0012BB8A9F|nr:4-hydroxy-tetrahydrodipicolinate reductase [Xanthovirga aplysinae]MTI30883.1 4-hydroxy-tetrahydrodipicolinate reductase [Xanthovirga aplysinae]
MNILILGYGKMGKTIEGIAQQRGHNISYIIDADSKENLATIDPQKVDIAIEFSQPEAAYANIKFCLENQIPVVSGTTGWLEKRSEIENLCQQKNGMFFYASNFSIGVNIFFKLNKLLAQMMDPQPAYDVKMEEIHHIHKKDSPSGTAITLAEGIMGQLERKNKWELAPSKDTSAIEIQDVREGEVPGTHTITYTSGIDDIEIKHTAHGRQGFALGAVLAAEWAADKKGILGMNDFLKL